MQVQPCMPTWSSGSWMPYARVALRVIHLDTFSGMGPESLRSKGLASLVGPLSLLLGTGTSGTSLPDSDAARLCVQGSRNRTQNRSADGQAHPHNLVVMQRKCVRREGACTLTLVHSDKRDLIPGAGAGAQAHAQHSTHKHMCTGMQSRVLPPPGKPPCPLTALKHKHEKLCTLSHTCS